MPSAPDHEVVEAEDGEAAVGLLEQQRFDVVLLDVMMPKMSCYEVLDWLKHHPVGDTTPVVMITSVDTEKGLIREAQGGAIDHVAKPFGYEQVKSAVEAALAMTPEQLRVQRDRLLGAAIIEASLAGDAPAKARGASKEEELPAKRRWFFGKRQR